MQVGDIAELYHDVMCRWARWGCSKPTRVIYYPTNAVPTAFDRPVNFYAPHAGSDRCPEFDPIPGYDELWS